MSDTDKEYRDVRLGRTIEECVANVRAVDGFEAAIRRADHFIWAGFGRPGRFRIGYASPGSTYPVNSSRTWPRGVLIADRPEVIAEFLRRLDSGA